MFNSSFLTPQKSYRFGQFRELNFIPGGYCHIWATQVCATVKGMVLKQYSGIGYIDQGVWVQNRVSCFRELIEDFSLDQGNQELPLIIKKSSKSKFMQLSLKATLGQRGFGEFNLVAPAGRHTSSSHAITHMLKKVLAVEMYSQCDRKNLEMESWNHWVMMTIYCLRRQVRDGQDDVKHKIPKEPLRQIL